MRRAQRLVLAATAAALCAAFAGVPTAEAKHRKPIPRELTVHKRPFTDSGRVVPIGTESNYVRDGSNAGVSMTLGRAPNSYGGETLPGRFELPGNRPLFNF